MQASTFNVALCALSTVSVSFWGVILCLQVSLEKSLGLDFWNLTFVITLRFGALNVVVEAFLNFFRISCWNLNLNIHEMHFHKCLNIFLNLWTVSSKCEPTASCCWHLPIKQLATSIKQLSTFFCEHLILLKLFPLKTQPSVFLRVLWSESNQKHIEWWSWLMAAPRRHLNRIFQTLRRKWLVVEGVVVVVVAVDSVGGLLPIQTRSKIKRPVVRIQLPVVRIQLPECSCQVRVKVLRHQTQMKQSVYKLLCPVRKEGSSERLAPAHPQSQKEVHIIIAWLSLQTILSTTSCQKKTLTSFTR